MKTFFLTDVGLLVAEKRLEIRASYCVRETVQQSDYFDTMCNCNFYIVCSEHKAEKSYTFHRDCSDISMSKYSDCFTIS